MADHVLFAGGGSASHSPGMAAPNICAHHAERPGDVCQHWRRVNAIPCASPTPLLDHSNHLMPQPPAVRFVDNVGGICRWMLRE
jgi:hypothetical protein